MCRIESTLASKTTFSSNLMYYFNYSELKFQSYVCHRLPARARSSRFLAEENTLEENIIASLVQLHVVSQTIKPQSHVDAT